MTCTVTGNVIDLQAKPKAGQTLTFGPQVRSLARFDSSTAIPDTVSVTADASGDFSVALLPGVYTVKAEGGLRGSVQITVPDSASALLEQIIDAPVPVSVDAAQQAVLDAREERQLTQGLANTVAGQTQTVNTKHGEVIATAETINGQAQAIAGQTEEVNTKHGQVISTAETIGDLADLEALADRAGDYEEGAEAALTAVQLISQAAGAARESTSAAAIVAGRALVADGETFIAAGDDTPDEYFLYRRDSSSTQTEVARYPSAGAVSSVAAREVGFIVPPALPSPLSKLIKIELFRSVSGVAVTLPSLLTVREIARDGLDRFRFRLAEFDGTSTYTSVTTENNTGGASINVAGYTGLRWMEILADGNHLGPADNTIIGRALIDFGSGGTFGTYAGTIAYSVGGIMPSFQQIGEVLEGDISGLIDASAAIVDGGKVPFSNDMVGDTFLRQMVRSIWLYGCDPTHEYAVSFFEVRNLSGPLTRFQIQITDVTAGALACSARYQIGATEDYATFSARLPSKIKVTDHLLGTKTLIYGVVDIDWSSVSDLFNNSQSATMATGGIHSSRTLSDEGIADHLDRDHWHQVIRCGAGEIYTTLRAAVEATYSPLTGSTLIKGSPICEFAHYHNRVLIDIVDDGDFEATGLYLPDWVDVRGNGMDRTFIRRENTDPEPLIEQRATGKFFDCTLISETAGEYCIHSDDFNRNATGDKDQNLHLRQSYKRLRLQGGTGHNGWLFGNGMSSGQVIEFEDVVGEHVDATATEPAFGFHNSGPTLSSPDLKTSFKPAHVIMRGCGSPDQKPIKLSTLEPSAICTLTLIDCHFPGYIQVDTSSGLEVVSDLAHERNCWQIGGRHDGPWLRLDPVGENVLKTTAGATPSGDAAALIFGAVDDLGRGEKWIAGDPADATTYSLGERLGDCSGTSKTLTVSGETHTFNTDLRAVANATIISQINAAITGYPVSIVDIQLEWVPDAAPKRRVNNDTGASIPKGRFVKFTGAATVALCGAGERPDGWTHRDILDGDDGFVVLTKRIREEYIDGADSGTGEWGITTAGTLDYSATPKLGRTIGGFVEVYA